MKNVFIAIGAAIALLLIVLWFLVWKTPAENSHSDDSNTAATRPMLEDNDAITTPELSASNQSIEANESDDANDDSAAEEIRTSLEDAMRDYGGEDKLLTDMKAWSFSLGFIEKRPGWEDNADLMLPQPYHRYDEDTLRQLALNGDHWAAQFLADSIESTNPQEALRWYREAAIGGSVYAMQKIGSIYQRVANADFQTLRETPREALNQLMALNDQTDAKQESLAWKALAWRYAGSEPMGTTAMTQEKDMGWACEYADSLQANVLAERDARGLGALNVPAPPFYASDEALFSGSGRSNALNCGASDPLFDFSNCQDYQFDDNDIGLEAKLCPPQ